MTNKNHNKGKTHNHNKHYYIYGKHPAIMALKNKNRKIIEILCTQNFFEENKNIIASHKYKIVLNNNLNDLLPQITHQGVIIKTTSISTDLSSIDISKENAKIAILDQITDPHNVGAILRSAAAFGITAIIMTNDNSAEENGIMAKTSCGGLEITPIVKVVNLRSTIDLLKKNGFWILGLDAAGKEFISPKNLSGKIAIILGSEGSGMRRLTTESCDILLKIPIKESMESINVSNAAAIVFYEASKI